MRRIATLLMAAGLQVLTAHAQTAALGVLVTDMVQGSVIPGATVLLTLDGAIVDSSTTGADGFARFVISTVGVEDAPDPSFVLGNPFPNPAIGPATFPLSLARAGRVVAVLYDPAGRGLGSLSIDRPAGDTSVRVSFGGVASGTYFLSVTSRTSRQVVPIQIVSAGSGLVRIEPGASVAGPFASASASKGAGSELYLLQVSAPAFLDRTFAVVVPDQATTEVPLLPFPELDMVRIPAGTFTMGYLTDPVKWPPHEVTLTHDFWMARYELTYGQVRGATGPGSEVAGGGISWLHAVDYVNRMSRSEGLSPCYDAESRPVGTLYECEGYRLPTEAEWEYAARGGTDTDWFFGATFDSLSVYGNCTGEFGPHPIEPGRLRPNPWGLYDVYGNVVEWTSDWHDTDYRSHTPVDPVGPASGSTKVGRGGYYGSNSACSSANRWWTRPDIAPTYTGLRVVRTAR